MVKTSLEGIEKARKELPDTFYRTLKCRMENDYEKITQLNVMIWIRRADDFLCKERDKPIRAIFIMMLPCKIGL